MANTNSNKLIIRHQTNKISNFMWISGNTDGFLLSVLDSLAISFLRNNYWCCFACYSFNFQVSLAGDVELVKNWGIVKLIRVKCNDCSYKL